jgi:hypothetical protein
LGIGLALTDFHISRFDLRLNGQSVRDAVRQLADRDLPFLFYSGLDATPTARSWPRVPLLLKPLPAELVANTGEVIGGGGISSNNLLTASANFRRRELDKLSPQ